MNFLDQIGSKLASKPSYLRLSRLDPDFPPFSFLTGAADLNALNLPNVHTFLLDVSQDSSVNSMKHLFESDYCSPSSNRNLFALFNIAGILRGFLAELSTIEDWKQVYEVNVFGVWRCCVALLPLIRETAKKFPGREGYAYPRIVTITSVVAELVFPGGSVYNSSKHAACGLLSTLRLELEDQGIKVVQVQPWFVNSAFFNVLNAKEADKIRERTPTEVLEVYGGEKALKAVDKVGFSRSVVVKSCSNAFCKERDTHPPRLQSHRTR